MSIEETISKDDFEKMKMRFRKEALVAVEEAEQRGFENGRQDGLANSAEDMLVWKSVAESVATGKENPNPVTFLKLVMEQVYKDLRKEFQDEPDIVDRFKGVLISSNKVVLARIPELISKVAPSIAPKVAPASVSPTPMVRNDVVAGQIQLRSSIFCAHFKPLPPKYFIRITIPQINEHQVKGMFTSSEFLSYQIEATVVPLYVDKNFSGDLCKPFVSTLDRRHSEFKTLSQQLLKTFPFHLLPKLKSFSSKHIKGSVAPTSSGAADTVSTARKRQYVIWMQYLSNLEIMQSSATFVTFLTGLQAMQEMKFPKGKDKVCIKNSTVHTILSSIPFNKGLFPIDCYVYGYSSEHLSLARAQQIANNVAYNANNIGNARNSTINNGLTNRSSVMNCSSENLHQNSPTGRGSDLTFSTSAAHNASLISEALVSDENVDSGGDAHSKANTYTRNKLAYQDLQTVHRDILQLEPNAHAAVTSTKHLVDSMRNTSMALNTFVGGVDEWSRCEPSGSYELHALRVLSSAISFTLPNVDKVVATVHEEFSEYLDFLHDTHLHSSKDTVEHLLKSFNSLSAHSGSSASSSSVHVSSSDKKGGSADSGSGGSTENNVYSSAVTVSKAWEAGRAVRSSMLLNQIMTTAQTLANEYKEATKQWRYAFDKLGGQAETLKTSLEEDSKALKQVILGEMRDLDTNVQSIKDSHEATNKMQDIYLKVTGALRNGAQPGNLKENADKLQENLSDLATQKSFQAIIDRPILPPGVRRDPTVKSTTGATTAADTSRPRNERNAHETKPRKSDPHMTEYIPYDRHAASTGVAGDLRTGTKEEPSSAADDVFDRRRQATAKRPTASTASKLKPPPNAQSTVIPDVFGSAPLPAAALQGVAPPSTHHPQHAMPPDVGRRPRTTTSEYNSDHNNGSNARSRTASEHETKVARQQQRQQECTSSVAAEDLPDVPRRSHAEVNNSNRGVASDGEPLPEGWEKVTTEDGQVYYFHQVTRISRWDRPTEKVAAALKQRLKESQADVDEALKRRKQDQENERRLQEEKNEIIEQSQSSVRLTIKKWILQSDGRTPKDLGELLCTVHTLVDYIPEGSISDHPLHTRDSAPIEIKKAYMRAVRFVHPDKLPDNISVENALLAEAVFIALTDAFNRFRDKLEAAAAARR